MPGLYPDDKIVNMYGEDVKYPGLDPDTQKFTDGDFTNPLKKPSFIPAATFNLILDNLESCIKELGVKPNNKDPDQLIRALRKWMGRGGYLDAYNFSTPNPTQQQLTNYALSKIPSITVREEIFNSTKITNKFDGHVWILTNTQDTVPAVFEWSNSGPGVLAPLDENYGGYAKGAASTDPAEYIRAVAGGDGKIKIDIALLEKAFFLGAHPVSTIFMTVDPNLNTAAKMNAKYPGSTWVAWGMGRVPMGVGSSEANSTSATNPSLADHGGSMSAGAINQTAAEIKGGNKSHTLTIAQMPSHGHGIKKKDQVSGGGGYNSVNYEDSSTDFLQGGGSAHNNIQPYITCYFYKRTA